MSDESFARRLRELDQAEAPDPAFVERLYLDLSEQLGFSRPGGTGTGAVRPVAIRRRRRTWPLLAVAALVLTIGIGALVASGGLPGPSADLLTRLRARGSMIVAVSREHPQVVLPGAAASGFDVEVADALTRRLSLGFEPVAHDPGSLGSLADRAHMVMSAADIDDWEAAGWSLVEPVYHWPHYLLVRADAPFDDPSVLAGRPVGTPEERLVAAAPPGAVAVAVTDDQDCLERLEIGQVDACLTATMGLPDVATRATIRVLGPAVAVDQRGPMIRASSDTTTFAAALRDAIAELRSDGTLMDLSRRFLGEDLTGPPKDS